MLSVRINNTSLRNDQVVISNFSRLILLICNKLRGSTNTRCNGQNRKVRMSEQNWRERNESTSYSISANLNSIVSNNNVSSSLPSRGKQFAKSRKESIFIINPVNLVNFPNFELGLILWQPIQLCNYNLVYGNMSKTVLPSQLSQNYFHRVSNEQNRRFGHGMAYATPNVNSLRSWEKMGRHSNSNGGFNFTVMSYNILAQDLLDEHRYLYTLHQKDSLNWHNRWSNLFAEICYFKPDIICLQEVQNSHLDSYFIRLENLGYRKLYKQRTGLRTDGCAIYYKHKVVNLIEYTSVEYRQPHVQMLDRDNVAIIAKFSPVNSVEKQFVVATTHLLYNPRRQDVRLAQIQLLLTEVDRIAFTSRETYLPVILTGDLNSTPDSEVYKFITRGKLRYENLGLRSLQRGVSGPRMGKTFLPKSLRITDQCQHANLLPKRQNNACISRSEELRLIELKHSERIYEGCVHSYEKKDEELFASGTLTHKFFLKSVYRHHVNGDVEGTTFQDEWVSVDYIFFSKGQSNGEDLILMERYRLPTRSELGNVKIPNSNFGSDHLSLIAKFQLRV